MADFDYLVSQVILITNRPELVAETQLAVRSATLQLHRSDFFAKDLTEMTLQFNTANYLQQIAYRELFPRYRALSYLRKYNPNYNASPNVIDLQALYYENGMGKEFEIITPDQIFDSYATQRSDVCYVAGETINVRSSTKDTYAVIGVYQSPDVSTPENYKSWIADESEFSIIYLAASIIFGTVMGNTSKLNSAAQLSSIEFQSVKLANIQNKGY